jgi:hypothetical protein
MNLAVTYRAIEPRNPPSPMYNILSILIGKVPRHARALKSGVGEQYNTFLLRI